MCKNNCGVDVGGNVLYGYTVKYQNFQTMKTNKKPPKSEDFEGFLVEISGIEPLTS